MNINLDILTGVCTKNIDNSAYVIYNIVFAIGDLFMDQDPPSHKKHNMEMDIYRSRKIADRCSNDKQYAQRLYAALCNTSWCRKELFDRIKNNQWHCSWRYAGDIVARLEGNHGSYMDWYCSGGEGYVHEEIANDLEELGWVCVEPGCCSAPPGHMNSIS